MCIPGVMYSMHARVNLSEHVSMSNNCEAVKKHFSTSPNDKVLHRCCGNLSLSAFICSNFIIWDQRFGVRG